MILLLQNIKICGTSFTLYSLYILNLKVYLFVRLLIYTLQLLKTHCEKKWHKTDWIKTKRAGCSKSEKNLSKKWLFRNSEEKKVCTSMCIKLALRLNTHWQPRGTEKQDLSGTSEVLNCYSGGECIWGHVLGDDTVFAFSALASV